MKIGIIGAGKVGCALAISLKEKRYTISGVYSRSIESANYLAGKLNLHFKNDIKEVVSNSDIIFITTSDQAISTTSEEISKLEVSNIKGKIFLHCSGALSSEEIESLSKIGAFIGSLHPIQTFADKETGWKGLNNIYFGFEGSNEAKVYAEEIVKVLNCKVLVINKNEKILYHTTACILSNYMVTLFFMAEELSEKIGLNREVLIKAFMPLVEKTISNINERGSLNSLTGPIVRGDDNTIEKHLIELEDKFPEILKAYKILGLKTVEASIAKGTLKVESYEKLIELLE